VSQEQIDALLPTLSAEAQLIVAFLRSQNAELLARITALTAQLEKMQTMMFGRRAERLPPMDKILAKQDAPTVTVDGDPMPSGETPEDRAARDHERRRLAREKSKPARVAKRAQRAALPVLDIDVPVQDDQLPAHLTRADFRIVGEGTIVERFEHLPARVVCLRYRLETLAARTGDLIIKAVPPPGVEDGCQYGPGLHAHVVTAKCADALPLYRIEQQLRREGCELARSVLGDMFHRSAGLLTGLYDYLKQEAQQDPLVHADETTLLVQRPGKGACHRGWIWTLLSDRAIVYLYDDSRQGAVATRLLGTAPGALMVDGYSGYNDAAVSTRMRLGCWAHLRRKVYEARTTAPEADELLAHIQALYRVEHDAANDEVLGTPLHLARRETISTQVMADIDAWVTARTGAYPPKHPLGAALTYFTNQRTALMRFLGDATLPLDNNAAERALRIIALGRKNFMFAGHSDAAQNYAILQSLVSTCQRHGVNPYAYLRDVLIRVQQPGVTPAELMPWCWVPPPPDPADPSV